jgi:hypothetical protein
VFLNKKTGKMFFSKIFSKLKISRGEERRRKKRKKKEEEQARRTCTREKRNDCYF